MCLWESADIAVQMTLMCPQILQVSFFYLEGNCSIVPDGLVCFEVPAGNSAAMKGFRFVRDDWILLTANLGSHRMHHRQEKASQDTALSLNGAA